MTDLFFRVRVAEDGTFTIPQVSPGHYVAALVSPIGRPQTLVGRERVEVVDKDVAVDDLTIRVVPSWNYSGTVRYEDGTSAGPRHGYLNTFVGGDGEQGQILQINADGNFTASGLEAGTYRVQFPNAKDLVVKTVTVNGREFNGGKIDVPAASDGTIDIVLSRSGASVSGTVDLLDPDDPVFGTVTIVPDPITLPDTVFLQFQTPDENGQFLFPLLEAGTYRVCAWNDRGAAVYNILNDPRFNSKLKGSCKTVKLKEEDSEQVQLKQLDIATFQ